MLKIFKHHLVVAILIILCFFSAFMVLCNGLLSTIQISKLIQKENKYSYVNDVKVTIHVVDEITPDVLLMLVKNINTCNIYLENMEAYFEQIDNVYRPDVLLKQNEALSLPTNESILTIPPNAIIVGSENVVHKEELSIHGEKFFIYDKLDVKEFPFVNGLYVFNGKDYFKAFPQSVRDKQEIILRIASNKNDVYSAYSKIQENVRLFLPNAKIYNSEVITKNNIFQSALSQKNLISIGVFIFALINTVIISHYWVVVRRREIAIRKAFGADNFSVIKLMTFELLKLVATSALVAFIIQILVWIYQGNDIDIKDSVILFILFIFSISVSVITAMIVPVHYILGIQASEGVKL